MNAYDPINEYNNNGGWNSEFRVAPFIQQLSTILFNN